MNYIILDLPCYITEKKKETFLGFVISEEKRIYKFLTERYLLDKDKFYNLFKQTNLIHTEKSYTKILKEYEKVYGELKSQCLFEDSFVKECKKMGFHPYDYYLYGLKRKKKKINEFKKVEYKEIHTFFSEYNKLSLKELIVLADKEYGELLKKQLDESTLLYNQVLDILNKTFNSNSITYDKFFNTINSVKNNISLNVKTIVDKKYYNYDISNEDFNETYNKNEELLIEFRKLKNELLEIKEIRNNPDNTIKEIKDLIEECKFYKK